METARRSRIREALLVVGGSLAASIAFTWPLVLHLNSRARDLHDTLFQAWTIDWVQHAVGSGINPYNANIFAPERTSLAFSDTLLGVAIPALPLRWLGMTPIGVLNVTIIVGLAASAAAAYLFARLATGSRLVAVVAGAAYAFGPFGALSARHVHVAFRPGVPLAAAAAWWLVERVRTAEPGASWRRLLPSAGALVAVVAWQGTISFYLATYAIIAAAVVLLVRWRALGKRGLLVAAGALAASAVLLAILAIPNLAVQSRDPSYTFTLADFDLNGANFGHTEPGLSVYGSILGLGEKDTMRNALFPGFALLGFAIAGAISGWRAGGRRKTATITGLALIVVGALLAIGTSDSDWRKYAPYRVLYELVPPFDALRATARAWMIGLLGLGLLAGFGALALARWLGRKTPSRPRLAPALVGVLVVVLFLAEGFDPWFDRPDARIPPVDAELAQRPPGGVVYLPMNVANDLNIGYRAQPKNLYGATAHHRITPNGYAGYIPGSYVVQSKGLWTLPDANAIGLLRELGVRYVVVHPRAVDGPWARLRDPATARPLEHVGTYGKDLLYELPPPSPSPPTLDRATHAG
jgi:hypothetical protein